MFVRCTTTVLDEKCFEAAEFESVACLCLVAILFGVVVFHRLVYYIHRVFNVMRAYYHVTH